MLAFSTQRRKDAKDFCCGGRMLLAGRNQYPFPQIGLWPPAATVFEINAFACGYCASTEMVTSPRQRVCYVEPVSTTHPGRWFKLKTECRGVWVYRETQKKLCDAAGSG
jgi:hypothetical protein